MDIRYFANTHKGRVRENNEDSYIAQKIWDDKHVLCVVIDGMGGYEGGEVAADIAKTTIIRYIEDIRQEDCLDLLKQAVTEANNEIYNQRKLQPQYAQMGCVLTAIIIDTEAGRFYMAHVGDTRLYQYSHEKLEKLSHDHSLVGYREEIGELTEEEAMNHPNRSIVERSLGFQLRLLEDGDFIDGAVYPIQSDTKLLLCSDGLCDMATSAEMEAVLNRKDLSVEKSVNGLIDLALENGGKDNVTVIVVEFTKGVVTSTEEIEANKDKTESDSPSSVDIEPSEVHYKCERYTGWCKIILSAVVGVVIFMTGAVIGCEWHYSQVQETLQLLKKDATSKHSHYEKQITGLKAEIKRIKLQMQEDEEEKK